MVVAAVGWWLMKVMLLMLQLRSQRLCVHLLCLPRLFCHRLCLRRPCERLDHLFLLQQLVALEVAGHVALGIQPNDGHDLDLRLLQASGILCSYANQSHI